MNIRGCTRLFFPLNLVNQMICNGLSTKMKKTRKIRILLEIPIKHYFTKIIKPKKNIKDMNKRNFTTVRLKTIKI